MSDARHLSPTDVVRQELRQFLSMAERTGMDADRLRHSLGLTSDDWQGWLGVVRDAPLPPHPAVPLVLRHLGYMTSWLDRAAQMAHA